MVVGSIWDALKPLQSDLERTNAILADLNVQMRVLDSRVQNCEAAIGEIKDKSRPKKKTKEDPSTEA